MVRAPRVNVDYAVALRGQQMNPVLLSPTEPIVHQLNVWAAINVQNRRILFSRAKVRWPVYHCVELGSILQLMARNFGASERRIMN